MVATRVVEDEEAVAVEQVVSVTIDTAIQAERK